jgi:hypothetical protein
MSSAVTSDDGSITSLSHRFPRVVVSVSMTMALSV